MKNALILHGSGCTPDLYWYESIKSYLESKGYSVWLPQLPSAETADQKEQLPFVMNNFKFNSQTIIIGHSAGCPLALAILERIEEAVDKVVLVAGLARNISDGYEKFVQKVYNWSKIKQNFKELFIINSDNDPWGCNDKEGRYLFDNLGGIQIVVHGEGHFGSTTYNQPYKKFELLEKLL